MGKELNIEAGQTWSIFFNDDNQNNRTIEVRAVVDEWFVVFRSWSERKQEWQYQISHVSYFHFLSEGGHLTLKPNAQGERCR